MKQFAYRAYGAGGGDESGVVAAANFTEASRLVGLKGARPYEIVETHGARPVDAAPKRHLFEAQPRAEHFFSEMSVLLNAGFTVDRALKTLIASSRRKTERDLYSTIYDRMSGGEPLSAAIMVFPRLAAEVPAILASGERSGRLDASFTRLAATLALRAKRRAAVMEALAYPCFLVVVMCCALVVLATVLVPALEPIFEGQSATKPMMLTLLSGLSRTLSDYPFAVPLVLLCGLLGQIVLSRNSRFRASVRQLAIRTPIIGGMIKDTAAANFLETLALLLNNGVTMNDALTIAGPISPHADIRARLAEISTQVTGGAALQKALDRSGLFDRTTLSLVAVGEEANSLPVVLDRAASILQLKLSRRVDAALKALTPLLTISLGLLIGGLVVSVMTTILSVNDLALQ